MNPRTHKNLVTAMQGEAFAYIKYMLFAEHARKNGNLELADLFKKTAQVERFEHLVKEAELAGLVGSDVANLDNAIESESDEVDRMYYKFAEQAADDGDQAAAECFSEVRGDEMGHRDVYIAALTKLNQSSER